MMMELSDRLRRNRRALPAVALLALVVGCTAKKGTAPAVRPAQSHATIALTIDALPSFTSPMRDLFTRELFTLESRGGLLVLRVPTGVIDTLSMPALAVRDTHTVTVLDSSFVRVSSVRGDTAPRHYADLVCVADGRLQWSAHLPSMMSFPDTASGPTYTTRFALLRSPLALEGDELFSLQLPDSESLRWRLPFALRFDDSARVFFNAQVELDRVPFEDGVRAVTGRHPAIALRSGTVVFVDGRWYALSVPEELDTDEFVRGTVGMVLEGKAEFGDTLRAIR